MNLPIKVIVKGKGEQTLDQNSYVAAGGFGTVCKLGSVAYKIYHDSKSMISQAKIDELQAISHLDNVLGPRDTLLDPKSNAPIGFTMPYIKDTEFLTRLFNKNYRADNSITPEMIVSLVKIMQTTLSEIHKCGILTIDFNEMNFLTTMKYDKIYFIDVDSYQTKSFPATALMESVRDRLSPKGLFSEKTDWFSFAIVSFQMYMTYHPYMKGKHPKYLPKDWSARMDKNISVFHPDVILADIWKDFGVIPPPHMEWYKAVFHKGDRCAPPLPDGAILIGPMQPTLITGNEQFVVKKLLDFPEPIIGYYFLNGLMYVITTKAIYTGNRKVKDLGTVSKGVSLVNVPGSDPVLAIKSEAIITFEDISGKQIGQIAATQAMHYNGNIYTVYNGRLTENSFIHAGKNVIHSTKQVSNIFEPATRLFSGVAIQDILGKSWVAIPYQIGRCINIPVKELEGMRIIDAKFEHHILMVISEKKGKYSRYIFCFEESMLMYTCRVEDDVNETSVSFTCLSNGICVHLSDDDTLEVFRDNSKIKTVKNPPITTDMKLVNDSTGIIFINKKGLYSLKLK
jgi:serine/threonine protein kinase